MAPEQALGKVKRNRRAMRSLRDRRHDVPVDCAQENPRVRQRRRAFGGDGHDARSASLLGRAPELRRQYARWSIARSHFARPIAIPTRAPCRRTCGRFAGVPRPLSPCASWSDRPLAPRRLRWPRLSPRRQGLRAHGPPRNRPRPRSSRALVLLLAAGGMVLLGIVTIMGLWMSGLKVGGGTANPPRPSATPVAASVDADPAGRPRSGASSAAVSVPSAKTRTLLQRQSAQVAARRVASARRLMLRSLLGTDRHLPAATRRQACTVRRTSRKGSLSAR